MPDSIQRASPVDDTAYDGNDGSSETGSSDSDDLYVRMPSECREFLDSLGTVEPPAERLPAFYFLEAWDLYALGDALASPSRKGRATAALLRIGLAAAQAAHKMNTTDAPAVQRAMQVIMRELVTVVREGLDVYEEMKRAPGPLATMTHSTPAIPDAPAPIPVPESSQSAPVAPAAAAIPPVPPVHASSLAKSAPAFKPPMLHADNSHLMPLPEMRYDSAPTIKLLPPKMPHAANSCLLPPSTMCHDSEVACPVREDLSHRAPSSSGRAAPGAPGLAPAETRRVSPPPLKRPRLSAAPTTTRSSLPVFRTPGFGCADSTSSRTDPWAVRIAPESENIPGACSTSRYRKRGQPPA
ncbi:hypothetical protein K466DRAFT_570088 [Polyporus arcularius HHB13444]|uniref:Uncharacterized protein n=1 Tax=Polyporus arcularius HHB13444 TaxID=1314778 RepID=A0A5C3NT14_9APHY|nr:hypothetical protein K466DRAFT_570088 [Polyporus arcularius HHB13444]